MSPGLCPGEPDFIFQLSQGKQTKDFFLKIVFLTCFCIADLVSNQSAEGLLEDCDLFGPARDDVLAMAVKMANVLDEPGQDLEADFPKSKS